MSPRSVNFQTIPRDNESLEPSQLRRMLRSTGEVRQGCGTEQF